MSKYALRIESEDNMDALALVDINVGSLAVVSYAAKEAGAILDKSSKERFRATLIALGAREGEGATALLELTADGGTVNDVLKVRLARLRAQAK